jgi:multimeric flavodoxin WrbA
MINMNHILILIGSPRRNGNIANMVNLFKSYLEVEQIKTEILFLYDYNISACIDCRCCKTDDFICKTKDDMNLIYEKMESADLIIFGTPIYWYGPTAKTKLLIDRLRPYYLNHKLDGKKVALFMTSATGETDADLTREMFNRVFNTLLLKKIGDLVLIAYDIPKNTNNKEIKTLIKDFINKAIANINNIL